MSEFQKELTVRVQTLHPNATFPAYATAGAAAMDLHVVLDAPYTLEPGARFLAPTGLAIEIPDRDTVCVLCARSGLSIKYGVCLANGIGVVDSDYRGEIRVPLINLGNAPYTIAPGERVAQMMFLPVATATLIGADSLGETERGAGGFGSTGK